jgi:hypothetical protein
MAPRRRAPPGLDRPQPLGYRVAWIALRTTDTSGAAAALGLRDIRPANWGEGIPEAYGPAVFVTPPLSDWTLAVGVSLFHAGEPAPVVKPLLERLSRRWGEAHDFATPRVVESHTWARAVRGRLVRGYGWVGERGETVWDEGEQTPEEHALGFQFFDERSPEESQDYYWAREDLRFPDEECVMRLAGAWSLDPTTLKQLFRCPVWGCSASSRTRRRGGTGTGQKMWTCDHIGKMARRGWAYVQEGSRLFLSVQGSRNGQAAPGPAHPGRVAPRASWGFWWPPRAREGPSRARQAGWSGLTYWTPGSGPPGLPFW